MISINGRCGVGQEFELEFHDYLVGEDFSVTIPETKSFRTSRFAPEASPSKTSLRWSPHSGEQRLMVEVGNRRMPFDDAPEDLRKALARWVDRLAGQLRKGRYQD